MSVELAVDGLLIKLASEREHLYSDLSRGQWYERDLLNAIREASLPGMVYVDVGAHIGNHSLFFATWCEAARVIAIEPHPENFALLEENISINGLDGVITPIQAVIHPSWRRANVKFDESVSPHLRSVIPEITEGDQVPCFTLDWALSDDADVVKIDVEGAGPDVLLSGVTAIKELMPLVAIEAEHAHEQGRISGIMDTLGYENLGQYANTPTFLWKSRFGR